MCPNGGDDDLFCKRLFFWVDKLWLFLLKKLFMKDTENNPIILEENSLFFTSGMLYKNHEIIAFSIFDFIVIGINNNIAVTFITKLLEHNFGYRGGVKQENIFSLSADGIRNPRVHLTRNNEVNTQMPLVSGHKSQVRAIVRHFVIPERIIENNKIFIQNGFLEGFVFFVIVKLLGGLFFSTLHLTLSNFENARHIDFFIELFVLLGF